MNHPSEQITTADITEKDLVQLIVSEEEEQASIDHIPSLKEQMRIMSNAALIADHHGVASDGFRRTVRATHRKLRLESNRGKTQAHIRTSFHNQ